MGRNAEFNIIVNIGDLSLSQRDINSCKIDFRRLSDFEYELFMTLSESCKIIFGKFSLPPSLSTAENNDNDPNCSKSSSTFKLHLWKTFYLPFNISHFSISNQSLWTLGENFLVDISCYLKPLIQVKEHELQTEKDLMEIDSSDDILFQEFEMPVEIISFQKYAPLSGDFLLNCHLFDNSIIICSKDASSMSWKLDLIIPSHDLSIGAEHSNILHLVNFPITYNATYSFGSSPAAGGQNDEPKPVISFIYDKEENVQTYNTFQMNFFKKLFGIFPSSGSNCICLIGHPEGKLLFCLCEVNSKEQTMHFETQPEIMFDVKQSIKGIHFLKDINDCKGNGSFLIIGKLGKLVFITANKIFHNSNEFKFKNESLYVSTLYLPTSIQTYALMRQTIIFISNKFELCVAEFSEQEIAMSPKKNELKFSKSIIAMSGIVKMVLLNEQQGLFLLLTRSGQLYLSKYLEEKIDLNLPISLPSLMNIIMHQSSVLHNLSVLSKMHQDFFANVTQFANLKFNGVQKLKVDCSVTEIDEPPKKIVININISSSDSFDSRFWFTTVYLYSFYQKDSIVISKTLPFETGQIITVEVQESLICPPHSSGYPLYLEVGLLLTLPETFKSEETFRLISKVMPLFIKIETIILNESYLLKSKLDVHQNKNQHDSQNCKNVLAEICSRNLKKPIAHLLHISQKISTDYTQDFSFCLFPNSLRQVGEKLLGESLSKDIVQVLKMRNNLADSTELESLTCRNQLISFHVSDNSDATFITLRSKSFFLLVGLRMAIMELLFNQSKSNSYGSKCVSISANVNKECEKLSKEILSMYGQDVDREGFMEKIISLYCQLRKISRQLPFY